MWLGIGVCVVFDFSITRLWLASRSSCSLKPMSTKTRIDEQLYRDDLAQIHIEGYGFHWERAAPVILRWFQEYGFNSGLLADLGCGGGQWMAHASEAGYKTIGIDVSPAMIRRAKKTSPSTSFLCASFAEMKITECDAVTSLGEPLNYLNSGRQIRRTLKSVYDALRENGLFVFDVRHPPLRRVDPINHVRSGDEWFCHALIEEDARQLVRHITTFQKVGSDYRRDQETHRLKLYSKSKMLEWLRGIGFRVRTFRGYDDYQLAKRQSVFVCRKA